MKVLHVTGPCAGGISKHITELRRGLDLESEQVELRVRPNSVMDLAGKIRREGYTLVHCHGFQGGAVGRFAAMLARRPAVVTIHNTLQVQGMAANLARFAEGGLARSTARWIAVSSFLRDYAQSIGIPQDRTQVIANGIDVPDGVGEYKETMVVGTVARLIPSKGIDIFLQALALVKMEFPHVRGVIIGDGPARGDLEALARQLGLEGNVEFTGHCHDVPERLREFSVFVLPTRSEGLGISIMEAMVAGIPVVSTMVGGVPELISHGETGLLAPRDDHVAVASAVDKLLGDRNRAEELRQAAFNRIAQRYSIETMLEKTEALYRRVVHA